MFRLHRDTGGIGYIKRRIRLIVLSKQIESIEKEIKKEIESRAI